MVTRVLRLNPGDEGLVAGVRFGREHDPATGYRELVVPPGSD